MGVTHLPQLMIRVDGVESGGGQQKEIAAILLLLVVTENHAKLERGNELLHQSSEIMTDLNQP